MKARLKAFLFTIFLVLASLVVVAGPAQASTTYYLPYPNGASYQVTQGPGGSTSHGSGTNSAQAIDFGLGTNDAIAASAPGTLFKREYHADFGNMVWLQHSDSYCTVYAHMSGFSSAISDMTVGTSSVSQGQVLGYAGSTGYSSGVHLHFGRLNCSTWQTVNVDFVEVADPVEGQSYTSQNGGGSTGSNADIFAVVRNDIGSGHTAAHVVNGSNWGLYLKNSATGLPVTDANWDFEWADYNNDGVLDLWAFNRNPGGGHTVLHVLNGANWGEWFQAGNIALPGTDANWDFEVADYNGSGKPDIFGINRNPGGGHTVVHVLNGDNWGEWFQAGDIALPATDANWDFEVGKYNSDVRSDIYGVNRNPGGDHTVVHVINGANWGQWLQAGNIALPGTDANWDFELGSYTSDAMPDIFGINRNPGGDHTVVHVINGANWGDWMQAGNIVLPATDANWDFSVGAF